MGVISIQSHVSYGHVGNSAAVFALQRAGHEVWPVHTVNLSNHTGYADVGGLRFDADAIRDVLAGMERRGAIANAQALLTGYLGSVELAEVIAAVAGKLPQESIYCCDPVLGNAFVGDFVDPSIPQAFRDIVLPHTNIITPNQYEVARLTGRLTESTPKAAPISLEETLQSVRELQELGPKTVLVTSLNRPDSDNRRGHRGGGAEMLAVYGDSAYLIETPKVPESRSYNGKFAGAGDLTAAVFLSQLLDGRDKNGRNKGGIEISRALEHTAYIVYSVIDATQKADADELELIACQDVFTNPQRPFIAQRVG